MPAPASPSLRAAHSTPRRADSTEPLERLCRLAADCLALPGVAVGVYGPQGLELLGQHGIAPALREELTTAPSASADADLHPVALNASSHILIAQTPLHDPEGRRSGTFCVVDIHPGSLDARTRRLLRAFARLSEVELHRQPLPGDTPATCPLTGLPTRATALAHVESMLRNADGRGRNVALVIADIADFNAINSAFGRQAGDGILRAAAQRLTSLVPDYSYAFRLQGDQFGIAVEIQDRGAEIEGVISGLATGFADPIRFGERDVVLHLIFGTAVYPHRANGRAELLDRAIIALREAQQQRTGAEIFTTELEERLVREVAVEQRLRVGLAERQVKVVYQPKVCLSTGRVRSVEALARWTDVELGFVSPAEFIPAAERSGLIAELGKQVLEQALRDVLVFRELRPSFRVSVNVAPSQLQQETYVQEVLDAFEATGAPYDALELEVVETSLVENIDRVVGIIQQLRDHGVAFAIDDFGTGYSSLSYLRRLPVQTLKLDRAFINEITQTPRDAALVESIISMAHVLDFEVVAEGVETEVQASMLREFLCDTGQGYLWARPASIDEVMSHLETVP